MPEVPTRGVVWRWNFPFDPNRLPFFYGWVIMVASTVGVLFTIPGQTMGVSVFTEVLIREMGLSRLQLSTAYLVGTAVSGFVLPMAGTILDRIGSRRMAVWVSLVFGVVLIAHRFLDDLVAGVTLWLWPFILMCGAFFLIRFLGQGCLTMASRAMLGKWFNRRRGIVFSLSGVALSFCFSAAPITLKWLIETYGWEGAYLVMGLAVGGVSTTVVWLLFRESPEEIGQVMDGKTAPQGPAEPEKNLDLVIHKEMTRGEALRTFAFWAYNLGLAYFAMLNTAYTFHVESIGMETGVGAKRILTFFMGMAVVSVFVNLLSGWLADRTRLKYILVACMAGQSLAMTGLLLLPWAVGIPVLIMGWGMAGGIFGMLSGVVWPRYFGRKHLGAVTGVHISSTVFGSAVGPVFFSLGQSLTGSYDIVYGIGLFFALALTFAAFFADNPQRKMGAEEAASKT